MAPLAGVGTLGEGGWWGLIRAFNEEIAGTPYFGVKTLVSCKCSQTNKLKRVQTESSVGITK